MASFHLAFRRTMAHEQGYANDPVDRGGETYRGISRKHWPAWEGWSAIDSAKQQGASIDGLLHQLDTAVQGFYEIEFWNRLHGSEMPQALAEELFDSAVNVGVSAVSAWLQASLNVLNRGATLYPDLRTDGRIGEKTMAALRAYLAQDSPGHLILLLNIAQGHHYFDLCLRRPDQERFIRGWLKRVRLLKRGGLDATPQED